MDLLQWSFCIRNTACVIFFTTVSIEDDSWLQAKSTADWTGSSRSLSSTPFSWRRKRESETLLVVFFKSVRSDSLSISFDPKKNPVSVDHRDDVFPD